MKVKLCGHQIQIDEEDTHFLKEHKWYAFMPHKSKGIYFHTDSGFYLHRLILPGFTEVDYKNGDTLDFRKESLRGATRSQQSHNKSKQEGFYSSQYKGVTRCSRNPNLWKARIHVKNREIFLGRFKTEKEAAQAYDKAAIKYFESYAKPNFK